MKKIKPNRKSNIKELVVGIIILTLSYLFMPGNVRAGTTPSFFPLFLFISGMVITVWGVIKFYIALIKR